MNTDKEMMRSFNEGSDRESVFMQNKKKCTVQYNSIAKRTSLLCSYMFCTGAWVSIVVKALCY